MFKSNFKKIMSLRISADAQELMNLSGFFIAAFPSHFHRKKRKSSKSSINLFLQTSSKCLLLILTIYNN